MVFSAPKTASSKLDLEVVAQVLAAAARGVRPRRAPPKKSPKMSPKMSSKPLPEKSKPPKPPALLERGVAEAIVLGAALRVAEDLVGLARLP